MFDYVPRSTWVHAIEITQIGIFGRRHDNNRPPMHNRAWSRRWWWPYTVAGPSDFQTNAYCLRLAKGHCRCGENGKKIKTENVSAGDFVGTWVELTMLYSPVPYLHKTTHVSCCARSLLHAKCISFCCGQATLKFCIPFPTGLLTLVICGRGLPWRQLCFPVRADGVTRD